MFIIYSVSGGVWIVENHMRHNEFFQKLKDSSLSTASPDVTFINTLSSISFSEIIKDNVNNLRTVPLLSTLKSGIRLSVIIESDELLCGYINMTLSSGNHYINVIHNNCDGTTSVYQTSPDQTETFLSKQICSHTSLQLFIRSDENNIFIYCLKVLVALVRIKTSFNLMVFHYAFVFPRSCSKCLILLIDDVSLHRLKIQNDNPITYETADLLEQSKHSRKVIHENSKKVQITEKVTLSPYFGKNIQFMSADEMISTFELFVNKILKPYNGELNVVDVTKLCPSGQEIVQINDNWHCSSCLPGHYYNKDDKQCSPCPKNYYQFGIRSENCKHCPNKGYNRQIRSDSLGSCTVSPQLTSSNDFYDWFSDIGLSNNTLNGTRVIEMGYNWKPSVILICLMFTIVIMVVGLFVQCAYYTTVKIFMSYVDL